jgi:hypothetical protein
MTLEHAVRLLAGTLVLLGIALARVLSPWWLLVPLFVGANLVQSSLTGFCPAERILGRLGVGRSHERLVQH